MNFSSAAQLYTIGQPHHLSNSKLLPGEYIPQPPPPPAPAQLQVFNSSEESDKFQNSNNQILVNHYPNLQQTTNESQFLPIYDPNYQSYMAPIPPAINGLINNPIYPIQNISPIPQTGNSPMNYHHHQYAYSPAAAAETAPDNYYIGLQNSSFIQGPDYYRSMLNLNHIRPFMPQMNYQSNQISVLNNIHVNSIDTANYLSTAGVAVGNSPPNIIGSNNNIESMKIVQHEVGQIIPKKLNQYPDVKSGGYGKTGDGSRKLFKFVRNKSKSMCGKLSNLGDSSESDNRNNKPSSIHRSIGNDSTESNLSNGQFIDLLVTNLDYNISAKDWKKLLLNQFQNAIKRVHSVLIQTQPDGSNCGIVRVNTIEDARLAISQFHRKKIGYKRIQVNLVNNNIHNPSSNNMKQEVGTLLKSVAGYSLSVYKFIELYEKKYHRNISISDFYKMKDFVEIKDVGGNQNWKIISLTNTAINSITQSSDSPELNETSETIVCPQHCKEGSDDYATVIELTILPNVEISLKLFKEQVHQLLQSHNGTLHLLSFLSCYKTEFNDIKIIKTNLVTTNSTGSLDQGESEIANINRDQCDNTIPCHKSTESLSNFHGSKETLLVEGVPLEHLLNCVPGIKIITTPSGVKKIILDEKKDGLYKTNADQSSGSPNNYNQSVNGLGGILVDRLHQFSREVVDLMKHQPSCRMFLSKFIPTYHHHFGKQCRVADYGFSKLHELIEALPQVVHVIGTGYVRMLYLGHKVQVRRFTNEMMKVLKSKITKTCKLSEYPTLYKMLFHKDFHIADYGVCFIEDLLNEIPDSTVEIIHNEDDTYIAMPKRVQTLDEKERTAQFSIEVVDLLKQSSRCRLPFNKFIPSYHHHFSRQCKVAEYGFTKLIELLDAVPHVIQIFEEHGEKYVVLTPHEMLRALAEQTLNILEKSFNKRIQLSEFANTYLKTQGYPLNVEDYGVTSVQQLMEKIPKIAKIQNYASTVNKIKNQNSTIDSNDQMGLFDEEDHESTIEQSETFICLADRNHVKHMAHKVLLVLLEVPSGSLPDYQFLEKYRYKYREEPNIVLIQNEMLDIIQIVNDSSLLAYPGSSGFHIRLKSLILFSRDLKDLMRFNQCKIPLMQLECFYEQQFGVPLKSQNYGYPTIYSLIQACDFVVTLKGRGIRATLVLCQDFVGKLAYRIAYNTQPIVKMPEENMDPSNSQRMNQVAINSGQMDEYDFNSTNQMSINNQVSTPLHSSKTACSFQSIYNPNIYPQNSFIPTYPYFNPQPIYNPWFRQWYQPHPSYGYTPNLYSHPEYGVVSISQSGVSSVSGSPNCLPYATASQDQKQIDELVETLAYDNSCSSTLTPPPAATLQQIQNSIEANNSIINNSWVIYPHQMMPPNAMLPGYITAVSNGDSDELEQPLDKLLGDPDRVHDSNNNNKSTIGSDHSEKLNPINKFSLSSKISDTINQDNPSKSIT